MNLQVKAYMCVVTGEDLHGATVLTGSSYLELITKVIDNIMETLGDTYPRLSQFQVPSSVDFIAEYDEDDYRSILNEMVCVLSSEGSDYKAKIFELEQEINNEQLVNISHDVF